MPLTDQHRFGMQLAQMSRGWRAELDRRLAGLGLSQARWLVLDSLETQGLVQRQAVAEDRRAKKIVLCAPALPLIEQIETIATQLRRELFEGVDEADMRVCMRVHGTILANLEKS
jgi:MarR family transcriptional regulator for hemolysin